MGLSFEEQIAQALEQHRRHHASVVGYAVLSLQQLVVTGGNGTSGTPIDTGQASSNWFVDVDSMNTRTTTDTTRRNLGLGQATIATALSSGRIPERYYLHNSLDYIRMLEFGLYPNPPKKTTGKTVNGYSTQAPQGMMRLALAKWESVLRDVSIQTKIK